MFKKVYASSDYGVVLMIISLLKANGFNPLDIQTSPHVSVAGVDIFYYVQVPDEEEISAKEFLISGGLKV